MKLNLILVSSAIFLSASPVFAASNSTSQAASQAGSQAASQAATAAGSQASSEASLPSNGVQNYSYGSAAKTKSAPKAQSTAVSHSTAPASSSPASGKMQIPPPPVETMPGHAVLPAPKGSSSRPEAVKTPVDNSLATVGADTYISKNRQVQRFVTYIELKPGMETAPLTMHIANQGFQWFRVLVANQVIATEKSLNKKGEADLDLTGTIEKGTNQLVVSAGGVPGAKFDWKLTTPAIAHIDKLDPADEVLIGSELKIKGKNFSTAPSKDDVNLNKTRASATRAKASEIVIKVPQDTEPGDNKVSVKVNGVESNKVSIKVRGIPELSGTSIQGVGPGMRLDIYGKNFSKDMSENRVYFGDTTASIVAGSTTNLTVVVPDIPIPPSDSIYQPPPTQVKVQVGKIMSKNSVGVNVGFRVWSEPGINPDGKDVPTLMPPYTDRNGMTIGF